MQDFPANPYLGQRLRFSALVWAEDVEEWAGLWMRVDSAGTMSINFDNMRDRPIQGTRSWQRYEIVLDISEEAALIGLGILLHGTGQVWVKDVHLEAVGKDVPVTQLPKWLREKKLSNLDFAASLEG